MNGDAIVFLILAVGGLGSLASGVVYYRGSTTPGKRAVGAGLAALGVAMLAILAFVAPVSVSGDNTPAPVIELQNSI